MEKLPPTLLSLIKTVIEHYKEMTWCSQEQNGKIRISMIWTNDHMKKYKSRSTRMRDRTRYEQYVKKSYISDNLHVENNDTEVQSAESERESDSWESEEDTDTDNSMDIEENINSPSRAPSQVTTLPVKSIVRTISVPKVDKQFNEEIKIKVTTNTDINKLSGDLVNLKSNQQGKTQNLPVEKNQHSFNDENTRMPMRFFQKIVMKTTGCRHDTLLGKIRGRDYIIRHIISDKMTEIVDEDEHGFRYLKKNIEEDFKDVQETKFMDESVANAIWLMEKFVEEHKLYRK